MDALRYHPAILAPDLTFPRPASVSAPAIVDELAAPDMRFAYSLHAPLRGRQAIREFAVTFRAAFPDLGFEGTAGLIAEEIGLDDGVTVLRQLGLLTGSTGP